MLKSKLIAAIQQEIRRHNWTEYAEEGVTVTGCTACHVKIRTTNQLIEHIAGAMPALIDRLSLEAKS